MTPDIAELQEAIRRLHGFEGTHVESVPVKECFRDNVVWEGVVEVFSILGHPAAKHCYAWGYRDDDGKSHYFAVLGVSPVESPVDAIRAAVVQQRKEMRE